MKTLEQIKNDYAVSEGFDDWWHLDFYTSDWDLLNNHWKNVCIIAQKECLKIASYNVDYEYTFLYSSERNVGDEVAKQITNENNIIK